MPPFTRLRTEVPISIAANPRTAPQSVKPTNRASRTIDDVRFTPLICGNALICARLRDDAHLAKHPFPSAVRTSDRGSFIVVRICAFLIVKARALTFWATTHPNSLDDLFPRHSTIPDCRILVARSDAETPCRRIASWIRRVCRKQHAWPRATRRAKHPPPAKPRQSPPIKIFHFTEIRNRSINPSSRSRERGDRPS
ncbi:hypothetical protein ABIB68_005370 [Bradyrhizobium sp. F1.2.2]|jgi:hypothetical protein